MTLSVLTKSRSPCAPDHSPLPAACLHSQLTPAQSTAQTVAAVWRSGGVPAFYRGWSTVVIGTIPARVVRLLTPAAGLGLQGLPHM